MSTHTAVGTLARVTRRDSLLGLPPVSAHQSPPRRHFDELPTYPRARVSVDDPGSVES